MSLEQMVALAAHEWLAETADRKRWVIAKYSSERIVNTPSISNYNPPLENNLSLNNALLFFPKQNPN